MKTIHTIHSSKNIVHRVYSTPLKIFTTGCTPYKDLESAKLHVTSNPIRGRLTGFCNLDRAVFRPDQLTDCRKYSEVSRK